MNVALAKSLMALVPASALLSGAVILVVRTKTVASVLQVLGATFLTVVVLTHIAEASATFPSMRWGFANSPGHYLDLASLVFGLLLFPTGYLWQAFVVPRSLKHSNGLNR